MKVLVVEDSATVAAYVTAILGAEPDMQVLPVAGTARDGVRMARDHRPDVVLMDMKLPDFDGIWAIEQIMADAPCPIVVLSGHLSSRERDITFESLRAGAVDVLGKPQGLGAQVREAFRNDLLRTVRLMSTAVVVRRRHATGTGRRPSLSPAHPSAIDQTDLERIRMVLIGASTGGPELLYRTLSALPAPFPLPMLITQHTLEGFDNSLAQWLSNTGHMVRVAKQAEVPAPGVVLLAPADQNLSLRIAGIELSPIERGRPITSVDAMFDSAARVLGASALGIILTGMGRDGSVGLRTLYERGALTVGQHRDSCVVASMPESARAARAVRHVMTPDEIAGLLRQLAITHSPRQGTKTSRSETTP